MKKTILILAFLFAFCSTQKYSVVEQGNVKILIGEFPLNVLQTKDFEWFASGYEGYKIEDAGDFEIIKSKANKFDVLVFLGTWCPDSRNYVPKFVKIMDSAGVSRKHLKFIGLGRDKKFGEITEKYGIKFVPTFIFLVDGKEIGRIVEHPRGELTSNIAQILESVK